jgi:hypothetical protein
MARKPRQLVADEVAKIRARFHEAIAAGMSIAEASAFANGVKDTPQLNLLAAKEAQPHPQPKPAAPPIEPTWIDNGNQPPAFAGAEAAADSKPAAAVLAKPELSAPAEKAAASEKKKVEIPDKFEGLPWPQLRSLALKIGATNVNGRIDAVNAIKAYLESHKR